MSTYSKGSHPCKEPGRTSMVADRPSAEEMARLQVQEHLLTSSMGGVLAEQLDPESFGRVLDIGCGTGGWLIETAQRYPNLSLLIGIDINSKMLDAARASARRAQVDARVEFHMMDALRLLEFPDAYFGLVNQRAGLNWLHRGDWPQLLQEYIRVARPRGIVRITEVNGALTSNSAALMRLWHLGAEAFYRAGIFFSPGSDNFGETLATLLREHGLQEVQVLSSTLEYRPHTSQGKLFIEDMQHLFHTIKPFLQTWVSLPGDYEEIYQCMLSESAQADFVATAELFTVWGTKSPPAR